VCVCVCDIKRQRDRECVCVCTCVCVYVCMCVCVCLRRPGSLASLCQCSICRFRPLSFHSHLTHHQKIRFSHTLTQTITTLIHQQFVQNTLLSDKLECLVLEIIFNMVIPTSLACYVSSRQIHKYLTKMLTLKMVFTVPMMKQRSSKFYHSLL
jgi:hypothetical protein